MTTCTKVKNPCKICLGNVTQKTGLQCQGICESWVHYSCLNYTPGKIKDIKAGVIKVNCPCPDCRTIQPKEVITKEPFSCNNQQCPANQPPRCDNKQCPVNIQFPSVTKVNPAPACPLGQCGQDCKKFSAPQVPPPPCPPRPCAPPPVPDCESRPSSGSSSSENCPRAPCCPNDGNVGDTGVYNVTSLSAVEQMCNTVGQLANQINDLMSKMKHTANGRSGGAGCYPNEQRSCSQKGPKSQCPKPCYCPGNPGKRRR